MYIINDKVTDLMNCSGSRSAFTESLTKILATIPHAVAANCILFLMNSST